MSEVFFGILSGGAGTRLWPVSRKSYPKQFYSFSSKDPLLVETLKRVEGMGALSVLTTKQLQFSTLGIINRHKINAEILPEPAPQNTAPIIAAFAELCYRKDPNSIAVVLPADHSILPVEKFKADLEEAIQIAKAGNIVTLGIPPRGPSTAYGYMELNKSEKPLLVKKFTEKPDLEKAKELVSSGAVWNSGIFIFSTKTFREALAKHSPQTAQEVSMLKSDLSNFADVYSKLPAISIDYALMEKLSDLKCVKATFNWSDLGSWEEIATQQETAAAKESKKTPQSVFQINAERNFYSGSKTLNKTVAFVGVSDLIAVETPDALLILNKGCGQSVKQLVDTLKTQIPKITDEHSFEERPWGRFEILLDSDALKSKHITVWPGQRLSYQSHKHRAEHWVIVEGEGEFTLNDEKKKVVKGDHLFIPLGAKHRISNPSRGEQSAELKFVEVQLGDYFGEDDIVRYDDDYGRN